MGRNENDSPAGMRLFIHALIAASFIMMPAAAGSAAAENDTSVANDSRRGGTDVQRVSLDRGDLECFLDGVVGAQMRTYHIAGVAAVVVADGELVFSKGYGYADLERRIPVDPAMTLFRTGSVGKLLTWTAVMQLAEKGMLALDADVNTYIDGFEIPEAFDEPVTLFHLLTHTPGFEDSGVGLFARGSAGLVPLGEWLSAHIPERIRRPGELTSYSNYGSALAGYVVECVSGMPFEEYVEERIFEPLGMRRSTFRQPPPARLAGDMSVGYRFQGGLFTAGAFELIPALPAGSMSTTAEDMAKFMIAHLQNGVFGGGRMLSEASVREMHRRQMTNDSRACGVTFGFMEMNWNGCRIIHHGGDTFCFHSLLLLVPEDGIGLYVSYNTAAAGRAARELEKEFLGRYYGVPEVRPPGPSAGFNERAGRFTGDYRITRSAHSTPEKILNLVSNNVRVTATDRGTLRVETGRQSHPTHWVEEEPLVFRNIDDGSHLYFRAGGEGFTHMFFENVPQIAMIKLPWHEGVSFHRGVFVACAALFLSAVVLWPVGYLLRAGKPPGAGAVRDPNAKRARFVAYALSTLNLFFAAAATIAVSNQSLVYGVPLSFKMLLAVPIITAVMAAAAIVYTVLAWKRRYWTVAGRTHYTLVTIAACVFVWFLHHWNLFGYHF
jgi:CubicO group peptidase (beta-lactamase class C family)